MMTMKTMEHKLQKADRTQSFLYLFCNFIATMLVTAYTAILFSPTVLNILPEGGDSRKQAVAIFVLALFGCIVFTIYSVSLFFRKKSRQLGILMALGASRKRLAPGLFREVLSMSLSSSLAGLIAGFPFVWIIWRLFRLFVVDSKEMLLRFDLRCLIVPVLFSLIVIALSCLTALRYLKQTNIMDVVHEEHKNEPVKEPGKWCGPVGIVLLFAGAVLGYSAPSIYMNLFSAYPPVWINLLYAPVFLGLYLIMLHTVVHSWNRRKDPYKNIISRSMMKFQGKQTVNNLLVSTVLIAGACFAIFYIPMMGTGQIIEVRSRAYDYSFNYRADQPIPDKEAIEHMAADYNLTIKDWRSCEYITLGIGDIVEIEEDDNSFHNEYSSLAQQGKFLSEDAYLALTGQSIDIKPGTYQAISNEDETGTYFLSTDAKEVTNMITRTELPVSFAGYLHNNMLSDPIGYYVLDNADYQTIAQGLSTVWEGNIFWFNIDGTDSYKFANQLYRTFVDSFSPECETIYSYDPVEKIAAEENGEVYWGDTEMMTKISFSTPDSSDFRAYWTYMPEIRILDQNDFLRSFAVYLMMFLFIAVICMLAVLIISYTRCQAIALNNRYVFDDLKRLGASPAFLNRELKSQCSNVFKIPAMIGMTAMYLLYAMIMYANDGQFTSSEAFGLLVCLGILILAAFLLYFVYRRTVSILKKQLEIE